MGKRFHDIGRLLCTASVFATFNAVVVGAANAQEQQSVHNSEAVVVTARRRAEVLQDHPGTANVFTTEALQDARVDGIEDIVARISNAHIEQRPGSAMDLYIRGSGTSTNGSATRTDSGVGLYLDGVYSYIQGSRIPLVLYDLDRVEVFKGPQGGLYGRNAVGGAFLAYTALPTDDFSYFAQVEGGSFRANTIEGYFNTPIGDDASMRVSLYRDTRRSYYDSTNPARTERGDEAASARVRFRFEPLQGLDVVLGYEYLTEERGPQLLTPAQFGYEHRSVADTDSELIRQTQRYLGLVTYQLFDGAELHSITGYTDIKSKDSSDLNNLQMGTVAQGFFYGVQKFGTDAYQFNQDLYLLSTGAGPLEWLIGVSYFEDGKDGTSDITTGFVNTAKTRSFTTNELGIEVFAAYLDLNWNITDRLRVGGSLRWSEENRSGKNSDSVTIDANTGLQIASPAFEFTDDYSRLSPSLSVSYRWTDNIMTYLRYSTGYQSGGINNRARTIELKAFGPSTAENYEIGLRTSWFDDSLIFNLTRFRLDQEDYQYQLDTLPFREFVNAGTARTDGTEVETTWRAASWLNLRANYAELDGRITAATAPRFRIGDPLIGVPNQTFGVGADVTIPLENDDEVYLRTNYSEVRGRFLGFTSGVYVYLDDYRLLDAKFGLRFGSGLEAYVFGENLTDDIHLITNGNAGSRMLSPPRMVGVGLSFRR